MYTPHQSRTIDAAAILNAANTPTEIARALSVIQRSMAGCFWVDQPAALESIAAHRDAVRKARAERAGRRKLPRR